MTPPLLRLDHLSRKRSRLVSACFLLSSQREVGLDYMQNLIRMFYFSYENSTCFLIFTMNLILFQFCIFFYLFKSRKINLCGSIRERTILLALKLAFCKSGLLICSTDGMYFHPIRKYFKANQSSIDGFL